MIEKNMKTLYMFITHQGSFERSYNRISSMLKGTKFENDYIVIIGGFIKDELDKEKHILRLNCNDTYGGLPEKVMKTFNFIMKDEQFEEYDYFCKLDEDMYILKEFDEYSDYFGGLVRFGPVNRRYHMGRCGNVLDKMEYLGDFSPWCDGGYGYVVSKNALKKITPNFKYIEHIYEDVYIALILNDVDIHPKINFRMTEYICSEKIMRERNLL